MTLNSGFAVSKKCLPLVIAVLVAIMTIGFSIGKDARQLNRMGDAAIFEQIVESINSGKGAVSNVFSNTQNYIDRGYAFLPPDRLAALNLEPPESLERDMLGFHAYYILFALAPLVNFMSSSLVLTLVQSSVFFGLLLFSCLFVYKQTKSYVSSLMFLPFIAFNPNWAGGIDGQFYPDRIFVIAGFILCYMIYQEASSWRLFAAAIFVGLVNERAALIGGLLLFSMPLYRRADKFDWRLVCSGVGMGGLLLFYAYIQKNYILTNAYYSSFLPSNLSDLLGRLQLDDFVPNIGSYLLNNILLIGLSLASPRLALLTFIVMLPNIVGNIGGAEKTNWVTHYHSYYFPVLSFSSAVGFSAICNKFVKTNYIQAASLRNAIVIFSVTSVVYLHYQLVTFKTGMSPFVSLQVAMDTLRERLNDRATGYTIRKDIAAKFEAGTLVSTDELGMALLHDRVSVSVFPVGLENADYLFLPCQIVSDSTEGGGKAFYSSAWLSGKGVDISSLEKIGTFGYCRMTKLRH